MPRVKQFCEVDVLTKAMALFWKKGYHATSIQDLVDHLGINRASLYDTYGGKQALFEKAFALYRKTNTQGITDFLNGQPHVKTGLRKLFEKGIRDALADADRKGCFAVNATTELVPGDDKMRALLQENKATFEAVFFIFLQKGEARGDIPRGKDLRALAALIFTLYNGLQVITKIETDPERLLASVDAALAVLD